MPGFASVIASAIKTVNSVTKSLQVTVQHRAWIRKDGLGKDVWSDNLIARRALVENNYDPRATKQDVIISVTVSIFEPVEANGAVGRIEPIDFRDIIILPDGKTGPIIALPGMDNPSTLRPYFSTIVLGAPK